MDQNWHRGEEYWIWKIRYLAERKMGKELKQSLQALKEEHIYLLPEERRHWILAGWIQKSESLFNLRGILVILGCFCL